MDHDVNVTIHVGWLYLHHLASIAGARRQADLARSIVVECKLPVTRQSADIASNYGSIGFASASLQVAGSEADKCGDVIMLVGKFLCISEHIPVFFLGGGI